jgi:predicted aspartyl protease
VPQVARLTGQVRRTGLFVDVNVGVSDGLLKQLWKKNRSPPPPVFATFLVDTGADTTLIEEQIVRTLNLSAINQRKVLTSESKGIAQLCDVYDVSIEVINRGGNPWRISTVQALARPLLDEAVQGVIGRDLLDRAVLTYNGPLKTFTIDYPY